jgi:hypothetical protein
MAERMCMEIFENPGPESIILDHIGDKKSREPDRTISEVARMDISQRKIMSDKEGREVIFSCREIVFYCIFGGISQIDDTEFTSFPAYRELECLEIDILTIESREF